MVLHRMRGVLRTLHGFTETVIAERKKEYINHKQEAVQPDEVKEQWG